MDAISLIVYGAIILASATVVVIALKKNGAITDLLVGGVTVSVKAAEAILKRFDKDPETMSPTDKIMRYAVIAVSSIEQQYKGIKTKMKNEGKDVTEMNAEMKEAAIRLLENLAAIDEYSLTDQDKASLGDIVEAALEMFINKR
ncbi:MULTISPECIES: hypothetical protein [unclassified Mesotoga]|nr:MULTISPECIES: hypothetical protein [unclassified Mesotoga]PZC51737.1 hypothetical protein LH53_09310 [Mesotoga sp. TolDC]